MKFCEIIINLGDEGPTNSCLVLTGFTENGDVDLIQKEFLIESKPWQICAEVQDNSLSDFPLRVLPTSRSFNKLKDLLLSDTSKSETDRRKEIQLTGRHFIDKEGYYRYINEHGYENCSHRVKLHKVITAWGGVSYVCDRCGQLAKRECPPGSL